MFLKTFCLLLVLAVVAYGLPYEHGGYVDPAFGRYPHQGGFAPDAGFGNGHGEGGLPSQVDPGFAPGGQGVLPGLDSLHYIDPGFAHGGQGGLPGHDSLHYGGGGDQHGNHQHGYKHYGY